MAQKKRAAPKFASAAFTDVATAETWGNITQQPKAAEDEVLPAKGPARSPAEFLEVRSHSLQAGAAGLYKKLQSQ